MLGIAGVTAWVLIGVGLAQAPGLGFQPRELFIQLDANQDGAIENEEVPAKAQPAFERLLKQGDTNHNGKLEAEEFRTVLVELKTFADDARKKAVERFKAMDKDHDGKVSREEFTGPKARFDQLDKDGDGYLTDRGRRGRKQQNSIGKEAIVRAGKPEMLAQRRPFVIAAKQAAALQLGDDKRDEIL